MLYVDMLVYIKCILLYNSSSLHTHTHTSRLADRLVWFSSVGLHSEQRARRSPSTHWVESESLESRLACVGVGVPLWWAAGGQWRVCVLRRRFSRDCRKERRALSSSRGEEPSSSTSAISAKVTGCVLKRASRDRRERLLPLAGPLGTGSCWGNSSMAEAMRWAGRTWKPEVSITIWRTAAIGGTEAQMGTKLKEVKIKCKCDHRWETTADYSSVLALSGAVSCLKRSLGAKTRVRPKSKKRSSKLQFQEHWRLLLCSSLLAVRASVSAWCLLPLCLSLCVNVSLLRLMPQTAPALSFIDAHHSLSLSLCSQCFQSLPLPSFPLYHGSSGLQRSHPTKINMRREYPDGE